MSKVIAVVNQKGGVAKTTTVNALGIGLAQKGYKVLLIDFDPQGNLSMSLGVSFPDTQEKTIALLMQSSLLGQPIKETNEFINSKYGVDFLIGNDDLGGIERMLSGYRDGEYTLDEILRSFKDTYDYIIIDCMPSVGNLTENAIVASDEIIVPSEPQFFSTKGIQSLFGEIGQIQKRKNPQLKIAGILPTKADYRTSITKDFLKMLPNLMEGIHIFKSIIPLSTKLAECNDGKNIYEYDKNGKGVQAYLNFVDEYLKVDTI